MDIALIAVLYLVLIAGLLVYVTAKRNRERGNVLELPPENPNLSHAASTAEAPYELTGDNNRERELLAKIRDLGLTDPSSIQRSSGPGLYFAVLPWPADVDQTELEVDVKKTDHFNRSDGTEKQKIIVLSQPKEDSHAIRIAKSIVELTKEVAQKYGCHAYYGGPQMVTGGALVMYFGLGDEPVTKKPA